MKITKHQALDIVKIIAHYELLTATQTPSSMLSSYVTPEPARVVRDLQTLKTSLESFLLSNESDYEKSETKDEDSSAETNEAQPCSQGKEGRTQASSGKNCSEEGLETDGCIFNSDLNSLTLLQGRIKTSSLGEPDEKVTLEFEDADFDRVDLVVRGSQRIEEIGFVKRTGNELHVAECAGEPGNHVWHIFGVSKFPRDWLQLMGAGCLYQVVDAGEED